LADKLQASAEIDLEKLPAIDPPAAVDAID
jgi:hypothetical protein